MKKINEKYYLESNKNNYILLERKVSKTTEKETFKKIGYYTNIEALYIALLEKEIRDDLNIIDNIGKIVELIKEIKASKNEI